GPIMVQTSPVRARRQDLGADLRHRTPLERLSDPTAGSAVTPRSIPRCDVASPDTSGAFDFFSKGYGFDPRLGPIAAGDLDAVPGPRRRGSSCRRPTQQGTGSKDRRV